MKRMLGSLLIAVALIAPAPVAAQGNDKTWQLSYVSTGPTEQIIALVRIGSEAGKVKAELVAASPRFPNLSLASASQDGKALRLVFKTGTSELTFEMSSPLDGKQVAGVVTSDVITLPAYFKITEEKELDAKSTLKVIECPPMQKARAMVTRVNTLRFQVATSKDPEKRKALQKQLLEADEAAKKETPGLYREVVEKHADNPAVFEAALTVLKSAEPETTKIDEVQRWAAVAAKSAKAFGPRWQAEIAAQLAEALLRQAEYSKLALTYARDAEKGLSDRSSVHEQARILGVLARALRQGGQAKEADAIEARAEKYELILDKEYTTKTITIEAKPFVGRKAKSDRAVFMELFTGATCPPCVAADVAFDVLQKTYKPSELVLIQYHLHIPGPDTMTNPDTIARWNYYQKAFPMQVRGVPTSLFNGKVMPGGGGPLAFAEKKYNAYREVIDPLLEEAAAAKLSASAVRKGDRIDVDVSVDFAAPGPEKKLRIVLAEETVRYLGSNRVRLHHNVVRACPGGVEGKALTEASVKQRVSVDVGEVRSGLTKYLNEFEKTKSFANPSRPLAMEHLRVIAFVQDDNTHEILQAVQVNVERK